MATNTSTAAAATTATSATTATRPSHNPPMNQSNTTTTNDNDNNSVLDLAEQTQRPVDNAFNQQRVNAWHPILDPVFVIIGLFYLGVIMVPTGTVFTYMCVKMRIRLTDYFFLAHILNVFSLISLDFSKIIINIF